MYHNCPYKINGVVDIIFLYLPLTVETSVVTVSCNPESNRGVALLETLCRYNVANPFYNYKYILHFLKFLIKVRLC